MPRGVRREVTPNARCASHPPRRPEVPGAEPGAVADATGRTGAPEGPARACSRSAAPTARQVAGAGIARRGKPGGLRRSGYSSPQVGGFAGLWSPGGAPSTVSSAAIPPRAAPTMPPTIAPGGPPTIAPVTSPAMAPTMAPPNAASQRGGGVSDFARFGRVVAASWGSGPGMREVVSMTGPSAP
jgi:hypothetical protein